MGDGKEYLLQDPVERIKNAGVELDDKDIVSVTGKHFASILMQPNIAAKNNSEKQDVMNEVLIAKRSALL